MQPEDQFKLPEPNPLTTAKYRREVFWQIYVPVIILLVVILAMAFGVGASFNNSTNIVRWSQVASMLLLLPMLVLTLLLLVFLVGLIYLVTWLLHIAPPYTSYMQSKTDLVKEKIATGADLAAEPFIRLQSIRAAWRALFQRGG